MPAWGGGWRWDALGRIPAPVPRLCSPSLSHNASQEPSELVLVLGLSSTHCKQGACKQLLHCLGPGPQTTAPQLPLPPTHLKPHVTAAHPASPPKANCNLQKAFQHYSTEVFLHQKPDVTLKDLLRASVSLFSKTLPGWPLGGHAQ